MQCFIFSYLGLIVRENQAQTSLTINPHYTRSHYSEHWDKLLPLQIKPVKINLMLNRQSLFFAPFGTKGLSNVKRELGPTWDVLRTGSGFSGRKESRRDCLAVASASEERFP